MARSTIEHFRALQKARAAGDDEAAQVIAKNMVDDMSTAERAMFGAGSGIANVVQNVGNILGFVEDETVRETRALTQPLRETTAGRVGEFAGELATSLLPAAGAVRALGAVSRIAPSVSRAPALARAIGVGATEGAVQGAVTAGPDERGESAYLGAVTGGLFPAAGAAYRAARSGITPTRSSRAISGMGVDLTPGQVNPRGVFGQLEENVEALPGVGPVVSNLRREGWRQTQKVVAQEALPPGASLKIPDNMNTAVEKIGEAYNDAYKIIDGIQIPSSAADDVANGFDKAIADPNILRSKDEFETVKNFLDNQKDALRKLGRPILTDDLLKIRSKIREKLRQRDISSGTAELLESAEASIADALKNNIPGNAQPIMDALRAIDSQYAKFAILRKAVYQGGESGSFTPRQLSESIRQSTPPNVYASGGGLMRNISGPAREVFETTQPKTGRMLLTAGALGLGGYGAYQDPYGAVAPLATLGLLYGTAPGRRLMMGQSAPQLAARALERQVRRAVPRGVREGIAAGARRTGAYAVPGLLVDEEGY